MTAAAALVALATGCGRDDIKVYRVAKETAPTIPTGQPDSGSTAPRLQWKLPAGWEEAPAGEMRIASFKVKSPNGKQADVSVVPLAGSGGGDLANVNRWRGQVGAPPVTEAELAKLAEPVEIAGAADALYDQAGTNPGEGVKSRILGAIQHRGDAAWFFKMTGDDELVAQQKPAFVEFLKSLSFGSAETAALPTGHPALEGGALPAGHPDISSMGGAASAASAEDKPKWQVPTGWQETPGGQFLVAKFVVGGDANAGTAVNVSSSPGDGGGLLANVNRWRQQLGLGPVDDAGLAKLTTSLDMANGKGVVVDFSGTDARTSQPARLVGAVVSQAGQTWFYKLMGDSKTVESQKAAFTQFVQTAKYHAP